MGVRLLLTGCVAVHLGLGAIMAPAYEERTGFQRFQPVDYSAQRRFGEALAVLDDTVAVGGDGRVVLYGRDFPVPGQWGEAAVLEGAEDARRFGAAVALFSGGLAVGAPGDRERPGGVARFHLDEQGRWRRLETLQSAFSHPADRFGAALAAAGEWLAIGVSGQTVDGAHDAGAVEVYRCAGGARCIPVARLADPFPESYERYGAALALSDRWLAVGAPAKDAVQFKGSVVPKSGVDGQRFAIAKGDAPFCGEDAGAVFLYRLDDLAAGHDSPYGAIAPQDAECLQRFGSALALDGDRLAVGSPTKDVADALFSGVVYVYQFRRETWREVVILGSLEGGENAGFGGALDFEGGRLLVGADGETAIRFRSGAAYLIVPDGDSWDNGRYLFLEDGLPHDRFGASVALQGENVWIGAPDRGGGLGAVYLNGTEPAPGPAGSYDFTTGRLLLEAVRVEGDGEFYRAELRREPSSPGYRFTLVEVSPAGDRRGGVARYFPATGRVHVPDLEVTFADGRKRTFTVDLVRVPQPGPFRLQVEKVR